MTLAGQAAIWRQAALAFRGVDGGAIARACQDKARIPEHLHQARVAAVQATLDALTASA